MGLEPTPIPLRETLEVVMQWGDEDTVWLVEDPECGNDDLSEEPLEDVPEDGEIEFFGED